MNDHQKLDVRTGQVSGLSEAEMASLQQLSLWLRCVEDVGSSGFMQDRTIIYVSPTR